MDKIRFEIDRTFFFIITGTIVINLVCMVFQYFSFVRMRETEEIYQDLLLEEIKIRTENSKMKQTYKRD